MYKTLEKTTLGELIKVYATVVENPVPGAVVKNRALMIARIREKIPGVASAAHVVATGAAAIMRRKTLEQSQMARAKKVVEEVVEEAVPTPAPRTRRAAPPPPPPVPAKPLPRRPAAAPAAAPIPIRGRGRPAPEPVVEEVTLTGTGRPRTGVGATIRAIILEDPSVPNKEIAAMALEAHPDSSTNAQCVAWYKNDMRKKGEIE